MNLLELHNLYVGLSSLHLYRRKDRPSWLVTFTFEGKQYRKTFPVGQYPTKKEVTPVALEWQHAILKEDGDKTSDRISFKRFATWWLKHVDISGGTMTAYSPAVKRLVAFFETGAIPSKSFCCM